MPNNGKPFTSLNLEYYGNVRPSSSRASLSRRVRCDTACTLRGVPTGYACLVRRATTKEQTRVTGSGNTVSLRYCERNMRFLALDKQKAQAVLREEQ